MFTHGDIDVRKIWTEASGNILKPRHSETGIEDLCAVPSHERTEEYFSILRASEIDADLLRDFSAALGAQDIRAIYAKYISHSELGSISVRTIDFEQSQSVAISELGNLLVAVTRKESIHIDISLSDMSAILSTISSAVTREIGSNGNIVLFDAILCLLVVKTHQEDIRLPSVEIIKRSASLVDLEIIAYKMLLRRENKEIINFFARIGISFKVIVRNILRNWFLGWLPLKDVMLISLISLVQGPRIVGIAIVLVMKHFSVHKHHRPPPVDNSSCRNPLENFVANLPVQCYLHEMTS
jgi:hypothetical protein